MNLLIINCFCKATLDTSINGLTPAQSTIISSVLSAIIAITAIFLNRYFERKKNRKEKYDAIKKYSNPIIYSSEQLAWRLKEILEFNGAYLLPDAPKNGFFKYKFDSTVFRLCVVLGWIQAVKKEQSYLEGIKVKHHKKIQEAILNFQKKLADGSHVEVSILDNLSTLFDLNIVKIESNQKALIGVEIEKIIFSYIPDNVKRNVDQLDKTLQQKMIKEILDHVCAKTNRPSVSKELVKNKLELAIKEVSREFCWIYRDWQSAIGDEMLNPISAGNRRFDVLGFGEFQSKYIDNEWLKKVDGLFSSLDVSIDDRFDSRVKQLKEVYSSIVELINVLQELINSQETISKGSLRMLNNFNLKLKNAK